MTDLRPRGLSLRPGPVILVAYRARGARWTGSDFYRNLFISCPTSSANHGSRRNEPRRSGLQAIEIRRSYLPFLKVRGLGSREHGRTSLSGDGLCPAIHSWRRSARKSSHGGESSRPTPASTRSKSRVSNSDQPDQDPGNPENYYYIGLIDRTETYASRQEAGAKLGMGFPSFPGRGRVCRLEREEYRQHSGRYR